MKLETIKGKLRARFSWQGKRLCLTFGLADTNRNRILAYKLIDKLETDILEGSFDGNLKRYIPKTKDRLENEKPNTKRTKKGYKTNRRDQRKPFTQQEIQAILNALSSNQFCPKCSVFSHSHYAPFVETILTLGCRNAELIGLQVKHVDFKSGLIEISALWHVLSLIKPMLVLGLGREPKPGMFGIYP